MCVFQKGAGELYDTMDKSETTKFANGTTTSPLSSKSAGKGGPITIENMGLKFGVNVNELKELMQLKGQEAKEKLDEAFGGMDQLAQKLSTDLQNGLSGSKNDLDLRVAKFGKNEIPPKPPKSFIRLALEACKDSTLVMLIICAVISIGLSFYSPPDTTVNQAKQERASGHSNLEWVEGVAIMIAVFVVVFVTAFNDWRKERQFRGLQDRIEQNHNTSVLRNGQMIQVNLKDLVVGDICCIKYGDTIPADGLVVQSSDLKIDESSLTGESDLIKKNNVNNFTLLSGTNVMEGSGQFLVIAVGLNSQTGIIMSLLGATLDDGFTESDDSEQNDKKKGFFSKLFSKKNKNPEKKKKKKKTKVHRSVLQIKLGKLALQIGYIGMMAALLAFLLLVLRMSIEEFVVKKNQWSNVYVKFIISYLIQGITVIVVAVPEGLPLAVTLALAFAVKKMTKDNNLVRHLDACETMGNATTICSDKTGTLTTNRMTVVQCWIADQFYEKIPDKSKLPPNLLNLIHEAISVNTNYTSIVEPSKQLGEMPKQIGNKTECGLLGFVNDVGGSYEKIRLDFPSDSFVKVYTFNSARKMMGTIVNISKNCNIDNKKEYRLFTKGASEIVLAKCNYYLNANNEPVELTEDKQNLLIQNVVEKMASDGLRTICIAYKDFIPNDGSLADEKKQKNCTFYDEMPNFDDETEILKDMTCLCLVGIEDPVRPEVPDAIRKCQTSGVVVRMVTGDNIKTATSIALKCGIIQPNDDFLILESKDFNKRIRDETGEVKQDLLDNVWPRLRVLARSSPQDKYILVNGIVESKLNTDREVVAVTGDGTNDGPALKRADVGFAMGIQGTDVAKEASDIILTDDNFSSIVKAMLWGRNVYDAIAKFLQFQLTANAAAGVFSVVSAAAIQAVPLKAVQMLWVNLVMDTLASLALATEPPHEDLLKRKPYGRNKSMISITMLKSIIGHSIYQLAVMFALVWAIEDWMSVDNVTKYDDIYKLTNPSVHFTIIFNAFVLMTLFNEFNARKIHNERNVFDGLWRNKIFILIWLFCFGGQILIVNFGGIVFAVEPIELDHWMWCLFLGGGSLLWGQLVISIPDKAVEKFLSIFTCCCKSKRGKKSGDQSIENSSLEANELDEDKEYIEGSKVLWVRSGNRLHNEMKVIETYGSKLNGLEEKRDQFGGSLLSLRDKHNEKNNKK